LTSLPSKILELGVDIKWEYYSTEKGIFLEKNPLENPLVEIVVGVSIRKKGRSRL